MLILLPDLVVAATFPVPVFAVLVEPVPAACWLKLPELVPTAAGPVALVEVVPLLVVLDKEPVFVEPGVVCEP